MRIKRVTKFCTVNIHEGVKLPLEEHCILNGRSMSGLIECLVKEYLSGSIALTEVSAQ